MEQDRRVSRDASGPEAATCASRIEGAFRKQVQGDRRVRRAFLLVHSKKVGVDLTVAGSGTGLPVHVEQPNHLASVGKLFTATLIAMLHEEGALRFTDRIGAYLDDELMRGLHVYRGHDYSGEITIRHLLMQTSGLYDVFYPLWKKMMQDPLYTITTRDAISWGKEHMRPVDVPGAKHHYTDTNYYLLGFIVESVTGKAFHEVMHERIFDPLGMYHAFLHGFSRPRKEGELPPAGLFMNDVDFGSVVSAPAIDHAGGSVIAPLSEYLLFMQALVEDRLIRRETLETMINDDTYMGFPVVGFNYGYSIWKPRTVPLLMPRKYSCWGCVGVTGAFMFYHPGTASHIIGTFNDFAYRGKALSFMVRRVIRELVAAAP
ncbi:MAG: serine hydrolase domain-containing protein [Alkalispirochaeta sp.]